MKRYTLGKSIDFRAIYFDFLYFQITLTLYNCLQTHQLVLIKNGTK